MQVTEIETRWTIFLEWSLLSYILLFWQNRVREFCAMAGGGFEMEIVIASLREKGRLAALFRAHGGENRISWAETIPGKRGTEREKNRKTE